MGYIARIPTLLLLNCCCEITLHDITLVSITQFGLVLVAFLESWLQISRSALITTLLRAFRLRRPSSARLGHTEGRATPKAAPGEAIIS